MAPRKRAPTTTEAAQRWYQYGQSYSADPLVIFGLNFFQRNWFGADLKGTEAMTFTTMMLALYTVQKQGLLMSKQDVMRVIGAEHVSTVKRYTDFAEKLGLIQIRPAQSDGRVQLLALTEQGIAAIKSELDAIDRLIKWVTDEQLAETIKPNETVEDIEKKNDARLRAFEFKSHLVVDLPKLEQLTLVAEPSSRSAMRSRGNPLSFDRWITAYSETIQALSDSKEPLNPLDPQFEFTKKALESRASMNEFLGENAQALKDTDKLAQVDPRQFLQLRAELHERMDRPDQVISDIDQLLKMDPDRQWSRSIRAKAYSKKGDWARALEDVDAAIAHRKTVMDRFDLEAAKTLDPDWEIFDLRATVHANLQQYSLALEDLQAARKMADRFLQRYESWRSNSNPAISGLAKQELVNYWQDVISSIDEKISALRLLVANNNKRKRSKPTRNANQ